MICLFIKTCLLRKKSASLSFISYRGIFCLHVMSAREGEQTTMGRRQKAKRYAFYNEMTEPFLPTITAPIPRYQLPGQTRARRSRSAIGAFFAAIITFINTLLAIALVLLLLLLFARFIMDGAHLTFGQYSYWITRLSTPLVAPFARYLPSLSFARYTIDLPTLVAMLAYLIGILLVRGILKRLVGK